MSGAWSVTVGRWVGGALRCYDHASSWWRERSDIFERAGHGVEPALELFGEGGGMVGVPGAGVGWGAGGHCDGMGALWFMTLREDVMGL